MQLKVRQTWNTQDDNSCINKDMSVDGVSHEQMAGQLCAELHNILDSNNSAPAILTRKKKLQSDILQLLARYNSNYLAIPGGENGRSVYFVRHARQKLHPLGDTQLLGMALRSWRKLTTNVDTTDEEVKHFIQHLKAVQMNVSAIRYPDPVYSLKREKALPFHCLDTYKTPG